MRVAAFAAPGGPEALQLGERPRPVPAAGEVLIRVAAAGVNRVDVLQRLGRYSPPHGPKDIPGVEVSGTVDACGPGAARFKAGDRVCALVIGGGYAEYVAVPEGQVLPIPGTLDFIQAAAVPETFFTVWAAQYDHGQLKPGESLLVHGGSSGIGTTAIMLAKALGAGPIFATAGSPEKCRACEALGATRAIDYRREDFVAVVRDATGGRGVDVILDMVAGSYVPRNLELLADDGRLVFISAMERDFTATFDVLQMMFRRLVITGISLRGQSIPRKTAIAERVERHAWPLLADGRIAPVIDTVYPLAEAAAAHARLESSGHIGKLVLEVTA
jgi:putative PIG3 family NAD(P)H quinone oxidoreductase